MSVGEWIIFSHLMFHKQPSRERRAWKTILFWLKRGEKGVSEWVRHTRIPLRWMNKKKEVIFRLLIWAKLRLMEKGLLLERFLFLSKCFQLDDKWAKFNALFSLHNGFIQNEIVCLWILITLKCFRQSLFSMSPTQTHTQKHLI